jgi:hypothetical protein
MANDKKFGGLIPKTMRLTPERTLMAQQIEATREVLAAQHETNRLLAMLLTERVR